MKLLSHSALQTLIYLFLGLSANWEFAFSQETSTGEAAESVDESNLPAFTLAAEGEIDERFRPLGYLRRHLKSEDPRYQFSAATREEWTTWQSDFRTALTEVFGIAKLEWSPLRIQAGPVDELEGYVRKAFTIETSPGLYVPAFLLVPADMTEPRPAVLIAHGHGNGMNALIGLDGEGEALPVGEDVHRHMALQSVRAGFPTLVYDQIGFGRRREFEFTAQFKDWNYCDQPSKWGIHLGVPIAGVRVFDAMRMIDFLQQREEVLPDRIGMAGLSGGGLVTQFTAALDERVRVACISGHLNTFEASILNLRHCLDNYTPGLGEIADNGDIACLIAPRPLIIEAGIEDHIFPIEATRQSIAKLEKCYQLLEASENLATDLFPRGHEFSGAKTWEFFHRHLDEQ